MVKPITTNPPSNNNYNNHNSHGGTHGRYGNGNRWSRNKQQQQHQYQYHTPASQNVASTTITADDPTKVFHFLRKHYLPQIDQNEESKAQWAKALEALHVLLPPKPQTPEEAAKSAHEHHEATKRAHAHKTKVLNDMRTKYQKLCEELVEYQNSIQLQEAAVAEALQLETAASAKVEELNRSIPPNAAAGPASGRSWQGLLTENLAAMLPSTISTDEASAIRQQFINFINTNSSIIAPLPPPPVPPPASATATATDMSDVDLRNELQHGLQQQQEQHQQGAPLQAGTSATAMSDGSIRARDEDAIQERDAKVRRSERSGAADPIGTTEIQCKAEAFAAAALGKQPNQVSQIVQTPPPP